MGVLGPSCLTPYGVSEKRGPEYSSLNSRILIVRTPKYGTPNFRNIPYYVGPSSADERSGRCGYFGMWGLPIGP